MYLQKAKGNPIPYDLTYSEKLNNTINFFFSFTYSALGEHNKHARVVMQFINYLKKKKKGYLKHYLLFLTQHILTLGRDTGLQATVSYHIN